MAWTDLAIGSVTQSYLQSLGQGAAEELPASAISKRDILQRLAGAPTAACLRSGTDRRLSSAHPGRLRPLVYAMRSGIGDGHAEGVCG
jgi:hypothetical protein